jgi:hypothetical protein
VRTRLTTLAALAVLLLPLSLHATITFERTYGGADRNESFAVEQTADGGYVIAGFTKDLGPDIYLVKTSDIGDTLWTNTIAWPGDDIGWSVWQNTDGGYGIAGQTNSRGAGKCDVALVRTDVSGGILWSKVYGDSADNYGYSGLQTFDGGFVVVGVTRLFGTESTDVYVIRTNADGDTLWTRTYGGTSSDDGHSVVQTTDGGFAVAGYITTVPTRRDFCLFRMDAHGDTLWTRRFGGEDYDEAYCVRQTTDGGFIVVGVTCPGGLTYSADALAIKTDASGRALWIKRYGGTTGEECFRSAWQTTDGGYIFAGYTASYGAGGDDVYLVRTDSCGDTLWSRTFGGYYEDFGFGVQQTADSGYVVAGWTLPRFPGADDVYLIKTDSLGNVAVAEPKANPTRASGLSLTCTPNPARGPTTIRLSPFALRYSPLTLRMYDGQGRAVLTRQVSTSPFPLSTSDLPSGTYFALLDATGQHATTRLVLQR